MRRWLERQRLRFPHLIECTRSCVLETICTALGIRCAVGSAGVAGYGCVWHGSSCPLFMLGASTPLYTIVAAYGSVRSLSFSFMVSVILRCIRATLRYLA